MGLSKAIVALKITLLRFSEATVIIKLGAARIPSLKEEDPLSQFIVIELWPSIGNKSYDPVILMLPPTIPPLEELR